MGGPSGVSNPLSKCAFQNQKQKPPVQGQENQIGLHDESTSKLYADEEGSQRQDWRAHLIHNKNTPNLKLPTHIPGHIFRGMETMYYAICTAFVTLISKSCVP